MIRVGRKLWDRQYVDGNGGNITYRIAPERVICTPTLLSKGDLTLDDFCLVDLEGNQMAGKAKRTSEVFLHLQIYKTGVRRRARRCTPIRPTPRLTPSRDVYLPTALFPNRMFLWDPWPSRLTKLPAPRDFAKTIIPYAKNHNTILLSNHGTHLLGRHRHPRGMVRGGR